MDYKKDTLQNGLRVITAPMREVKSVTAMIVVGIGSRHEEKEHQGVAHFTEHMMFKGTKRRSTSLVISSELDSLGAVSNAFTSNELIGFYVQGASRHLPHALDVLSDVFLNSKFDEAELERERGVILEERRMDRDNPRDHIGDLYFRLVFGDHPLGWEIVGREETIKGMQREHLVDYVSQWFKAGNSAVVVAGNVDREKTLTEVARLLGRLETGRLSKALPFEAIQKKPKILVENRKTDQTHLALGVKGYSLKHPRRYACSVLNTILGQGASSRLFMEVRERRGLAYYIGSSMLSFTDTGILVASSGVNNKRLKEAISAIVGELQRLREKTVPDKELRKAKEMIRGHLALNLENSGFVARFFVAQELLERKVETPGELVKKIDAVNAEEVREVAKELFVNKRLNLALIGPFKDEARFLSLLDLS